MYNNGIWSTSTATINNAKYSLFVMHDFTIDDIENWKRVEPLPNDEAELHK